jgi:probable rRNA maturation factor
MSPVGDDILKAAPGFAVEVIDSTGRLSEADRAWLRDRAVDAAGVLRCRGQLAVRVIDDAEMSAAHEQFCGISGTTDVLTFDLGVDEDAAGELPEGVRLIDADLLACVDEATRQASVRGHSVREELLLYTLHGVLHCLGYDDHDEEAFATMHAREDEVLRAIGLPALFRAGAGGAGEGGGAIKDGGSAGRAGDVGSRD